MATNKDTSRIAPHLDFIGGVLVGVACSIALICIASAAFRESSWWESAHLLFSHYGSLLAGAGAVIGAALTVAAIRRQVSLQRELFDEDHRKRVLKGYGDSANEVQAGALEVLGTTLTLQLRCEILRSLASQYPLSAQLTADQMNGLPLPPPLTNLTRTAMGKLRGSAASRALSLVGQLSHQQKLTATPLKLAIKETEIALINASEAYLYLSAVSAGLDTMSKGLKRGTIEIAGKDFFDHFEKIAAEGGLDLSLINSCYQQHSRTPFWRDKNSDSIEL